MGLIERTVPTLSEAHFIYLMLFVAEGTIHPINRNQIKAADNWDRKNDEGIGLIQLAIKLSLRESSSKKQSHLPKIDRDSDLSRTYTGLNLWVMLDT